MENVKTICVITRYCEKLDWIDFLLKFVDKIVIYNKGNNDLNLIKNDKIDIINLPNVGRIDHTIAYHKILSFFSLYPL